MRRYETPELTEQFKELSDLELYEQMIEGVDRDAVEEAYTALPKSKQSIYAHLSFFESAATDESRIAHQTLVGRNMEYVPYLLNTLHINRANMYQDSLQEGWLALSLAVWQWNPERGALNNLAYHHILTSISKLKAQMGFGVRVSTAILGVSSEVGRNNPDILEKAEQTEDADGSLAELLTKPNRNAEELVGSLLKFRLRFGEPISLDALLEQDPARNDYTGDLIEETPISQRIVDETTRDGLEDIEDQMTAQIVLDQVIDLINERELEVLRLESGWYDATPLTHEQIGRALPTQVGRVRVGQLKRSAVKKIAGELFREDLEIPSLDIIYAANKRYQEEEGAERDLQEKLYSSARLLTK